MVVPALMHPFGPGPANAGTRLFSNLEVRMPVLHFAGRCLLGSAKFTMALVPPLLEFVVTISLIFLWAVRFAITAPIPESRKPPEIF